MKVTIEGKEIDLDLTEEQKAVVEEALRPKTGWERVSFHGEYFTMDSPHSYIDDNNTYTRCAYKNAMYFTNAELAENIARAQTLQRKLWRRSSELCEKIDWDDVTVPKWSIKKEEYSNDVFVGSSYMQVFRQVYFDTVEHAKQALEEFRDELTWYFTEFKSRMD